MRLSGVFIALCMVLIAGSLGLIVYLTFGFARLEAAVIAVAALTGLMLVNAVATRTRDHTDLSDKIADLSRGTADLARQVAEIGRRVAAAEAEVAVASNRAHAAIEPVSAEIEKLGTLVEQLAGSVAAHENALVLMVDQSAPGVPGDPQPAAPAAPPRPTDSMPPRQLKAAISTRRLSRRAPPRVLHAKTS